MASGFYLFNPNRVAGRYNNLDYPYTGYMGFGLNFVGGDVSYTGEKFALTIGLRFGTAASQLTALAPVKEEFVSWIPHRKLTLDLGWFDTIYGAAARRRIPTPGIRSQTASATSAWCSV